MVKPKVGGDPVEGVSVTMHEMDGFLCTRVAWQIAHLRRKTTVSLGKPIVSPSFAIENLTDVRLLMMPASCGSEEVKGRSKKMHKKQPASSGGPIRGGLKLKVGFGTPTLRFYLTVGSYRWGPVTWDFTQHSMHGCDEFDIDWLAQADEAGTITVGLDVVMGMGHSRSTSSVVDCKKFSATGGFQLLKASPHPNLNLYHLSL